MDFGSQASAVLGGAPAFDWQQLDESLAKVGNNLCSKAEEKEVLINIEQLKLAFQKAKGETRQNNETALSNISSAKQLLSSEEQRRKELLLFKHDLKRSREGVIKLEQWSKELQDDRVHEACKYLDK